MAKEENKEYEGTHDDYESEYVDDKERKPVEESRVSKHANGKSHIRNKCLKNYSDSTYY